MLKELENIKENCLMEITVSSGFRGISTTTTIITKEKEVYEYINISKQNIESLNKCLSLTDNQFNQIIDIIENEILTNKYAPQKIMDISYLIKGNYNNKKYVVMNNMDLYNKLNDIIKKDK